MLNHVVNSGLALYDTFGTNQLSEGFNRKEMSEKLFSTWKEKIDQFSHMYL